MADAPVTQNDPPAPAKPAGLKNPRVRLGLAITAAIVVVLAVLGGGHWLLYGRFIESTDDAYLRADQVVVAPRVSGYIDQIYVVDNQKVTAGQPLLRVDLRNYRAALSQQTATVDARVADITAAESQVLQQEALVSQLQAQLVGARAAAAFAEQEARRFKGLRDQGAETDQRYAEAVNQRNQAAATVASAEAGVRVAQRQVTTLQSQMRQSRAQLEAAQASVNTAKLNFDDTLLRASVAGRVGDNSARLGQYVQPGTRLMSIVPVQSVYLIANFKETQIARMRIGQPAKVRIDALGDEEIPGRIESFAPGTGAQFALLPPENATGNFIKIVQRVPVRVRLTPQKDVAERLLPGLSVTVRIDTSANGTAM